MFGLIVYLNASPPIMIRNILLLILTLSTLSLFAQEKTYKISGTVSDKPEVRYAQLVSLEKKAVTRVPVANGRFEFNLKKSKELDMRALMLTADSSLTYENYMQETRSRMDDSRMILVEDAEITSGKIVADAVVKGSSLNKDLEDMFATIKSQNFEQYFAEHSDSPVSMLFLKSLAQIGGAGSAFHPYDCKKYFALLSNRLQQSQDGLALA
jgi:hypothetical protein